MLIYTLSKSHYFQISGKRWKIDLQAKQESHLMLSAVSLPGSVQRRRTAEDELQMRSIFKERDLVSVCNELYPRVTLDIVTFCVKNEY